MKESKVVSSLREAIRLSGLQDGMCVSFHHHLRNGDYVVNMVMEQISAMGIRDLTVNAARCSTCTCRCWSISKTERSADC